VIPEDGRGIYHPSKDLARGLLKAQKRRAVGDTLALPVDPLCLRSATELAGMIRAGEVSSREVVDAHIRHIERVDPSLRAVVRDRFVEARREADLADARRARDPAAALPAFHGVPCTIKESFAVASMPWTAGLVARRDVVATEDAPTVARLREAGMIPLAVTNTSELCMWMESVNKLHGRTGSAYDATRTAGGSSGGEGALVGAGASPVGLGADVGGSIRMPAFFNGVFGHKPTPGLVPNGGQYPNADPGAQKLLGTGPIVRRAGDLMPVLRALAGPHPDDRYARAMTLGDPSTVDLRDVTVLDVRESPSLGFTPVDIRLLDAQERCAHALAALGAKVRSVHIPSLRRALPMWATAMSVAAETPYATLLGNGTTLTLAEVLREFPRAAVGRSQYTVPSLGLCLLERATKDLPVDHAREEELTRQCRAEVLALLGDRGVLLYPSHTRVAPKHMTSLLWPVQWGYTAVFNALELPVTQCPLGLTDDGLPLGVQVVGAPGNDHVTIRVAERIEEALGGWVPPPQWANA
jgi:fatty acid amide hydrolase 2